MSVYICSVCVCLLCVSVCACVHHGACMCISMILLTPFSLKQNLSPFLCFSVVDNPNCLCIYREKFFSSWTHCRARCHICCIVCSACCRQGHLVSSRDRHRHTNTVTDRHRHQQIEAEGYK